MSDRRSESSSSEVSDADERKLSLDASAANRADHVKGPKETGTPAGKPGSSRPTDQLCQCLQKCSERVSQRTKDELFKTFVGMESADAQNKFLLKFIVTRPVKNRLFSRETSVNGRLLRRIYCKYRISLAVEDFTSGIYCDSDEDEESDFDKMSSVASVNSKDENDNALESDSIETPRKSCCYKFVDVCQKAFLNLFGVSDSRLKSVRELLVVETRQKHLERKMRKKNQIAVSLAKDLAESYWPLMTHFNKEECNNVTDQLMTAVCDDINLIDNFFYNQLWKPEYINQKL